MTQEEFHASDAWAYPSCSTQVSKRLCELMDHAKWNNLRLVHEIYEVLSDQGYNRYVRVAYLKYAFFPR